MYRSRDMEYRPRPFTTEEDRVYARTLKAEDLAELAEQLRQQALQQLREQVPYRSR